MRATCPSHIVPITKLLIVQFPSVIHYFIFPRFKYLTQHSDPSHLQSVLVSSLYVTQATRSNACTVFGHSTAEIAASNSLMSACTVLCCYCTVKRTFFQLLQKLQNFLGRSISGVNVRLKTKFRKLALSPSSGSTLNINCTVLCAHFNKMYIRGYTTIICHLRIRTVKDKNSLLVFKNSARRSFLAFGSNGKNYSWSEGRKTLDHPDKTRQHPSPPI
jgi:hypothetical protein